MTVKELKEIITNLDDNTEVIVRNKEDYQVIKGFEVKADDKNLIISI